MFPSKPLTPRLLVRLDVCVELEEVFSRFLQDSALHLFQTCLMAPDPDCPDNENCSVMTTFSLVTDGRRGWMCCTHEDPEYPDEQNVMTALLADFFESQPYVVQLCCWGDPPLCEETVRVDEDPTARIEAAFERHFGDALDAVLDPARISALLQGPPVYGSLSDEKEIRELYAESDEWYVQAWDAMKKR